MWLRESYQNHDRKSIKDKVGDDARMKTNICIEDKIFIEKRTNGG